MDRVVRDKRQWTMDSVSHALDFEKSFWENGAAGWLRAVGQARARRTIAAGQDSLSDARRRRSTIPIHTASLYTSIALSLSLCETERERGGGGARRVGQQSRAALSLAHTV